MNVVMGSYVDVVMVMVVVMGYPFHEVRGFHVESLVVEEAHLQPLLSLVHL